MKIIRVEIESVELKKLWEKYKAYMLNEHGIKMNADDEFIKLNQLYTLTSGSETKSVDILQYCMMCYRKQLVELPPATTFRQRLLSNVKSKINLKQKSI